MCRSEHMFEKHAPFHLFERCTQNVIGTGCLWQGFSLLLKMFRKDNLWYLKTEALPGDIHVDTR